MGDTNPERVKKAKVTITLKSSHSEKNDGLTEHPNR